MFSLLVLLFFLLIPVGFGFGLAVYLKREYEKAAKAGDSPVAEDVLDILRASSVSQDILLAKNKVLEGVSDQTVPPTSSGIHKLDASLTEDSVPAPQKQEIELPPEPQPNFDQNTDEREEEKRIASVIESPRDLPTGETVLESGPPERNAAENPLLNDQNSLVVEAMSTLNGPEPHPNVSEDLPSLESIMAIVKASSPSQDILLAKNKTPENEPQTE